MGHPWDDRWTNLRPLGSGGQGVTKLAKSTENPERTGVLKYLKNNKSIAARARMRREVANLQSLRALGGKVPDVYDHNTDAYKDTTVELYLVMEFIKGETLAEFVKSNEKLAVNQSVDFSLDLCKTVEVAHNEGILHRDLKPDNIVVRDADKNDLWVVDYGLSFNAEDEDVTQTVETFRNKFLDLPETNTPGGNRRDPRSDVTALCAVFYFMLSGHRCGQLQDADGNMPHLRPGFLIRDCLENDLRSTQIELLLSQGLAPQMPHRFQSIDEYSSRLRSVRAQELASETRDPLATASQLSDRLRELDRKTQLAEFQSPASNLMTTFINKIQPIRKHLGRFRLTADVDHGNALQFPNNLDALTPQFFVKVQVNHHPIKRQRFYRVGSRGEQCVVCACDDAERKWVELEWYEDLSIDDVVSSLENEFKVWLDNALHQLASEVLKG